MILMFPAALLSGFGSLIAGVWLLFLWEWQPLLAAFALSMIGPFVVGFALMPGLMFGLPAAKALQGRKLFIGALLTFLHNLYMLAILVGWSLLNLLYFTSFAESRLTFILNLILSSGVVCGVLAFLASKEPDNPHSGATTSFVQLAYALAVLGLSFRLFNMTDVLVVFVISVSGWIIFSSIDMLRSGDYHK